MNTILFIGAGFTLAIVVLSKIPGLEHMVRPIIDLLFTCLKAVLENAVSWSVWLFKLLLGSHIELLRNLTMKPEALDPTVAIREMTDD